MKIGIIGAGPGGLSAIRHCLDENFECVAYEQTGKIGGVWNYTEDTDVDENGIPVHSSMYQGLRSNVPKELMEFQDFHFKNVEDTEYDGYISQHEVLKYIHQYAAHFNLQRSVKLHHQVISLDPTPNDKWTIKIKNVKTKELSEEYFDAVIVANGHYFEPLMPSIPGMEYFTEHSIHSHFYRKANKYKDTRVLILGGGPSGVDISRMVAKVANKVYLGHDNELTSPIPENVKGKPRVDFFESNTAIFKDGSREVIDEIIFCTGYMYSFPFFSKNCKISTDDNWVKPLYKHLVNIEHPTMAIINIPNFNCPFPLFGLQLRFFLALLRGHFKVTKEEMYEDLRKDKEELVKKDVPLRKLHIFGPWIQEGYLKSVADSGNIKPLPPVLNKLFIHFIENASNSNKHKYRIVNDEEFIATPIVK